MPSYIQMLTPEKGYLHKESIETGMDADLAIFDDNINIFEVFAGGKSAYKNRSIQAGLLFFSIP